MFKQFCVGVLAVAPAMALGQGFIPIVSTVSENSAATEITIDGTGFGSVKPSVTLAGKSLMISAFNVSTITAQLPNGTTPGTYLITIENNQTHLPGVFAATLGAQGLQGVAGPQGLQGAQGFQGLPGAQGISGPAGVVGAQGPAGVAGAVGVTGAAGPVGAPGVAGAQGPIGLTGATGIQGLTGLTGGTGPQGPIGLTGATGAQGIQGLTGAAGAVGAQGATGMQGAPGMNGTNGAAGATGVIGPAGPAGSSVGQSYSANFQLPSNVGTFVYQAPVLGVTSPTPYSGSAGYPSVELLIPAACTAQNFMVQESGGSGTNPLEIAVAAGDGGPTPSVATALLSCTLVATSVASCSNSNPAAVSAGTEVFLFVQPVGYGTRADLDNARFQVSWTCS